MTYLVLFVCVAFGSYLSFYVLYTLMFVMSNFFHQGKKSPKLNPRTRFMVIIPAYNEELLLEKLLKSLAQQDYQSNLMSVVVVADNCSDETANVGRKNGALVLERCDPDHRGKGYAIKHALDNTSFKDYDAIFIVDADSVVSSNTLKNLDLTIQEGARIIQCYNGLANPNDSWFTRLMHVSRTFGNEILGPGKEKMALSSSLMGNGMCFVRDVLNKYGWHAFTVGEDVEYFANMALQGERIAFANKARVYHRESVDLQQATPQRLRWSSGRFAVSTKYGLRLLFNGFTRGRLLLIDAALHLILPNPSLGISLTVLLFLSCVIFPRLPYRWFLLSLFLILAILQVGFFLIGVLYVEDKRKKLMAIFLAPVFLFWKSGLDLLSIIGVGRKSWVRTERKF